MARVQGDMLVRKFVVRITCLKDKTSRKNFMIKKSQTRSQFKTQFAYCPELVMFLASRRCSVLVKIIKSTLSLSFIQLRGVFITLFTSLMK